MPSTEKKRQERGRQKVGVYLDKATIEELKLVGQDLHARGLGGNLSDVLRLLLTVCRHEGLLDAAKLTRKASAFDTSHDMHVDDLKKHL